MLGVRVALILLVAGLGLALGLRKIQRRTSTAQREGGGGEERIIPPGCEAELQLVEEALMQLDKGQELGEAEREQAMVALQRLAYKLDGKPLDAMGRQENPHPALSQTEKEVMGLIAAGHTSEQIAQILRCSVSRVYKIRSAIRKQLGIPKDADLKRAIGHARR